MTSAANLLQEVGEQGERLTADHLVAVSETCRQARHVRVHQRRVLQDKSGVKHTMTNS